MKLLTVLLGQLAFSAVAVAQTSILNTYSSTFDPGNQVTAYADITGPALGSFKLFSAPHNENGFDFQAATLVTTGTLDASGLATATWTINNLALYPDEYSIDLLAKIYPKGPTTSKHQLASRLTNTDTLPLTGVAGCVILDGNYTIGPAEPVAGQLIDDEWELASLTISADNANSSHPDKVIIFDSANPTGGDTDLVTPGYGPGNDTPLGNLLIIPENDVDANNDGLVDDPNDEKQGGFMHFDFGRPAAVCSLTVLDIDLDPDEVPSRVIFYYGDGSAPTVTPIPFGGDNSVQTLAFKKVNVIRMDVFLGGSGAVARMGFVPCPVTLLLGESQTGVPLDLPAGTIMTNQLNAMLGINISALNNKNLPVAHPDLATVFDTDFPTGGDDDLKTSGPGIGNTKRLGKVLIIAENDVDANNDGLIDDPDDELYGGSIRVDFNAPVEFLSTKVLDIDEGETAFLRLLGAGNVLIVDLPVASLGNNSVQLVVPPAPVVGVRAIELHMNGSGALSQMNWCLDTL